MNTNRKNVLLVAGFAILLVATLFTAGLILGYGEVMYQKGLSEGIDINKEDVPFEATVYWYKNDVLVWAEHNVITNVGLNYTRHLLCDQTWVNNNATTNAFRWMAIGTGSGGGASSTNLTTLFDSQIATFAEVGGVSGNFTMTYTWAAGSFSGQTITEAGMFDIAASNAAAIMLNYQDFTGIVLQSTDSLQLQFMFQISSG